MFLTFYNAPRIRKIDIICINGFNNTLIIYKDKLKKKGLSHG